MKFSLLSLLLLLSQYCVSGGTYITQPPTYNTLEQYYYPSYGYGSYGYVICSFHYYSPPQVEGSYYYQDTSSYTYNLPTYSYGSYGYLSEIMYYASELSAIETVNYNGTTTEVS